MTPSTDIRHVTVNTARNKQLNTLHVRQIKPVSAKMRTNGVITNLPRRGRTHPGLHYMVPRYHGYYTL